MLDMNNYPFPHFNGCTVAVGNGYEFHTTHYTGCNCFSLLGLKLIHMSKRGPWNQTTNAKQTIGIFLQISLGYHWIFLLQPLSSICVTGMLFNGPLTRYVKLRVPHAPGRKALVCDPGIHHGTCATHLPWCMSGSLTRCGGENVLGISSACTTRNFTYLARGPCLIKYWHGTKAIYSTFSFIVPTTNFRRKKTRAVKKFRSLNIHLHIVHVYINFVTRLLSM